jgi:hypothetical protein
MTDKKSAIYSDRPRMTMACDLIGHGQDAVLSPYNARLRTYQRMFHGLLSGRENAAEHTPVEEYETHRFLARVVRNPDSLQEEIRR